MKPVKNLNIFDDGQILQDIDLCFHEVFPLAATANLDDG